MPREVNWNIAKRRKPLREMAECGQKDLALAFEKLKARIRARVERPFHVVENIFRTFGAYFSSPHRRAANLATAHPSSESSYRIDKSVVCDAAPLAFAPRQSGLKWRPCSTGDVMSLMSLGHSCPPQFM